ncbi:PemK domain-containing protein [Microbacterium mangrovi]|uniref:PemK domain-containing protein n=1 Tax=Microbacterium mangrovi TaxID=1348253 RepID=A0A0B2A6J7_9MICO|nr:type II toxin-antitoxin system PemK/MazF family toxin [Microbacterium mangrovi]KHK97358.1 PemK domain-containing protein [Microbacterium mangrovi]
MASGFFSRVLSFLFGGRPAPAGRAPRGHGGVEPGRTGANATVEIAPPGRRGLRIAYAPARDGDPDGGEIIWTWVPYAENDGRGKDRPVLVIGRRDATSVYAVKLTSKPKDGNRDYIPLGTGPWDTQGRPSWLDVDQVYVVHHDGMRREAAALDVDRFARVAQALHKRYGWAVGE